MERIRRFFRKLGKGLKAKGYTLLEVAAVVAVTGTLAAVAMPVVADKIAAGKLAAAQDEVQSIRTSIISFMKDTGVPPFYSSERISASGLALPKEDSMSYCSMYLATKDGVNPTIQEGTAWTLLSPIDLPQLSLDGQLIDNFPKYPTMGISAWKGPYIPSLKKDPWGNRYLVAIKWLAEPVGTVVPGVSSDKYQRAVFVISAGPNGIIETKFEQKIRIIEAPAGVVYTFVVGGDDIVSRIQ